MDLNSILQFILDFIGRSNTNVPAPTPAPVQNNLNTIFITRGVPEVSGIYGSGSLSWDSFIFESLENDEKVIPAGTYRLQWHTSKHLNGEIVPELIDVSGRSSILIHEGNFENCSEGCILVGSVRDGNAIDNSKTTLKILKEKITIKKFFI